MASIEKRGKNSWRLVVEAGTGPGGKRDKRTKTIRIEDEALLKTTKKLNEYLKEELIKFKMEVESGEYIVPTRMTLEAFVRDWRDKYAETNLTPLTVKIYSGYLKSHILPVLGHKRLDEIKPIHIVNFLADLQKPGARKDGRGENLSGRTIQYIYAVLRNVLTVATNWQMIKENPMKNIKKPKADKPKAAFYETDEVEKIIAKLYEEPEKWRLMFLGYIMGGFRRGELIALQWPNVDFNNNTFFIEKSISLTENGQAIEGKTKNEEDGYVDMPKWYMDELKKYRLRWLEYKASILNKWQGGDNEYVFPGEYGKAMYFQNPSKMWKLFCEKHGIRYISLHKLRHTSVTMLIERGVPMKAIQQRVRHKQSQTTSDIYSHVTKKLSREVADQFNDLNPKNKKVK